MKFKQYIAMLQHFADKHPETLDLLVVCSGDDEGNDFRPVHYSPIHGMFDGDYTFIPHTEFAEVNDYEGSDLSEKDINAICIN